MQSELLLRLHAVILVHLVNLKHNKKFYVIMADIYKYRIFKNACHCGECFFDMILINEVGIGCQQKN